VYLRDFGVSEAALNEGYWFYKQKIYFIFTSRKTVLFVVYTFCNEFENILGPFHNTIKISQWTYPYQWNRWKKSF